MDGDGALRRSGGRARGGVRTAPASAREAPRRRRQLSFCCPRHGTETFVYSFTLHNSDVLDEIHAVLEIKELLGLVLAYLRADHLSTLVPLTRTCRALGEPALDLNWAATPLWYLACIMSESAWTRTYRDVSDGEKEDLWTIVRRQRSSPSRGPPSVSTTYAASILAS
jgi:hypothetical protein